MNALQQLQQMSAVAVEAAEPDQVGAAVRDAAIDSRALLDALASRPLPAATGARSRTLDDWLARRAAAWLQAVPGRVAVPVDARLAFDAAASIARAQRLVELCEKAGAARERLRITLVASWEGIQAARALEHQGIRCQLTLVFSLAQAAAGSDAGVAAVAPRIAPLGAVAAGDAAERGVELVRQVYAYFRKFEVDTEVTASGVETLEQVQALAGCDALALAPALLAELQAAAPTLQRRLDPASARAAPIHALSLNEAGFRFAVNDDAFASQALADGIRTLAAAARALERAAAAA